MKVMAINWNKNLVIVVMLIHLTRFDHQIQAAHHHKASKHQNNENRTKLEKSTTTSGDSLNQICEMIQNSIDASTYSMDTGSGNIKYRPNRNRQEQQQSQQQQKSLVMEMQQSIQRFRVDLNLRSALIFRKNLFLISNDWLVYEIPNVNFESNRGSKMLMHNVDSVSIELKWPVLAHNMLFRNAKSLIGAIYSMTHFIYFQLDNYSGSQNDTETKGLVFNLEKNTIDEIMIYSSQQSSSNLRTNTRITTLNNEMFSLEIDVNNQYVLVRWSLISNIDLANWSSNRKVLQMTRKETYYLYYRVSLVDSDDVYRRIVVSRVRLDSLGPCSSKSSNRTEKSNTEIKDENEREELWQEREQQQEEKEEGGVKGCGSSKSLVPIRDWDNYQSGFIYSGRFIMFEKRTILLFSDIVIASVMKREFPTYEVVASFNQSLLVNNRKNPMFQNQNAPLAMSSISLSYIETDIQSIEAEEYFFCYRLRLSTKVVIIAGIVAAILFALIVSAIYWTHATLIKNQNDNTKQFNRSRNFQSISRRPSYSKSVNSLAAVVAAPSVSSTSSAILPPVISSSKSSAVIFGDSSSSANVPMISTTPDSLQHQSSNSSGKFLSKSDGSFKTARLIR